MTKRGFIMNEAFVNALAKLNDTEFRECVTKTYDYAVNDVMPTFDSISCELIFGLAKPFIDSNNDRYAEKQKENGKLLGKIGG